MIEPISSDDARLCAGVVREVVRAKGIANDPGAVAKLTVAVARLFNKGLRERDQLMAAAMEADQAE